MFLHVNVHLFQYHLLKTVSSILFFVPLSKINWLYLWVFSSLFCSIDLFVYFSQISHCLDKCNSTKSWSQVTWVLQFCFSPSILGWISGYFPSPYILKNSWDGKYYVMIFFTNFLIKWQWIHVIKAVESGSKNEGLFQSWWRCFHFVGFNVRSSHQWLCHIKPCFTGLLNRRWKKGRSHHGYGSKNEAII